MAQSGKQTDILCPCLPHVQLVLEDKNCISREGVLTDIYPASTFCAVTFKKKQIKNTDDSQVHRSVL